MDKKYFGIIVLVIALLFMYLGTVMFYNTGLGITDLKVEKSDSNAGQYELSYMLRSVRSFNSLECQYTLFSEDNREIGSASNPLTNITDGSFAINKTIDVNSSENAKQIEIRIYEIDENNKRNLMFEQKSDI
ncbi:MAG: hypothetical protein BZ138_04495 [Methanosphaera sp. rholeuAM270]|nr:MAG: hypothetical protein BZ138_04495 [Methanosphaera sp. rholeuAM270]